MDATDTLVPWKMQGSMFFLLFLQPPQKPENFWPVLTIELGQKPYGGGGQYQHLDPHTGTDSAGAAV